MNNGVAKSPDPLLSSAMARLAEAAVCAALRLPPVALRQRQRGVSRAAFARQAAMYLAHVGFGLTMSRVGVCFGRDRTTVRHACTLVEDRRDQPGFELALAALELGMVRLALGLHVMPAPERGR